MDLKVSLDNPNVSGDSKSLYAFMFAEFDNKRFYWDVKAQWSANTGKGWTLSTRSKRVIDVHCSVFIAYKIINKIQRQQWMDDHNDSTHWTLRLGSVFIERGPSTYMCRASLMYVDAMNGRAWPWPYIFQIGPTVAVQKKCDRSFAQPFNLLACWSTFISRNCRGRVTRVLRINTRRLSFSVNVLFYIARS